MHMLIKMFGFKAPWIPLNEFRVLLYRNFLKQTLGARDHQQGVSTLIFTRYKLEDENILKEIHKETLHGTVLVRPDYLQILWIKIISPPGAWE